MRHIPNHAQHSRRHKAVLSGLCGVGLLLTSGCASVPWAGTSRDADHVYSTTTPQMLEQQADGQPAPVKASYPDPAGDERTSTPDNHLSHNTGSPSPSGTDGIVRLSSARPAATPDLRRNSEGVVLAAGGNSPNPGGFQLTSFQETAAAADAPNAGCDPVFTPAEPRFELDPSCPQSNCMELAGGAPLAELFQDEYVMDGGDRDNPFAHHTRTHSGLDSEDTVAEFIDHTGTPRVCASNRVAVYAPRFGSVRTITGLAADIRVDRAQGTRDSRGADNLITGNAAQENVHSTILSGMDARDRADGMNLSQPPMEARRTDAATQSRKIDEGQEGRSYASLQTFNRLDGIVQQQQVLNAVVWTRELYPIITASTQNAGEVTAQFKVQQTIGLEDQRKARGCGIQIIKLADRESANSGDIITFTLRFRNTGDFDVYDVRIVDNLTPRLEYITGSAVIDAGHPGEVEVAPNGEGSSILTFLLDQPLKGNDEGTITFEARVR